MKWFVARFVNLITLLEQYNCSNASFFPVMYEIENERKRGLRREDMNCRRVESKVTKGG